MRKILLSVSALAIAFSAGAENLVDTESDAFGEAVRNYLLTHPEVIFEAVDIYNAQQEAKAEEDAMGALSEVMPDLLDESTTFIIGNPDAKIAIVEFLDYNCGYCRKAHEAVNSIVAQNNDVKVIIRQFPILSQGSLEASSVVMVIDTLFGAEKAIEFHNAAYEHEGALDKESSLGIAEELGFDRAKIEEQLNSEDILKQIAMVRDAAVKLKIEGTPGFIIGDQIIRGYVPEENLTALIEHIRDNS